MTVLPTFKYHPDPLATGSIVASDKTCEVCGHGRGFIYTGAIYCPSDLESICPWCIADGSAHARFEVEFTDIAGVGDYGNWGSVSKSVAEEVSYRTPGFSAWQQERWFTHCEDAAEFLGPMGHTELEEVGPSAVAVVQLESGLKGDEWEKYFERLDQKHHATAYLFGVGAVERWVAILTASNLVQRHGPVRIRSWKSAFAPSLLS